MAKYLLRNRTSGYTVTSNNVINIIKDDPTALGIYVYLLSLPNDWEFYKTELCKTLKIGIKKLEAKLKRLKSHSLIEYGQLRNKRGQFETFTLDIYDTETPKKSAKKEKSPDGQNCRTVKTVRRSGEATKETIQNKDFKKQKKDKSFYEKSNSKKHDFADSMNQMASEQKHIAVHEKRKAEEMKSKRWSET